MSPSIGKELPRLILGILFKGAEGKMPGCLDAESEWATPQRAASATGNYPCQPCIFGLSTGLWINLELV